MIEDKIQNSIKPILTINSDLEIELIKKIAEHFKLNEEFINSDYWYFEKLKEMGVTFDVRKVPADSKENMDSLLKKAKTELQNMK